jgi:hypothetical protein
MCDWLKKIFSGKCSCGCHCHCQEENKQTSGEAVKSQEKNEESVVETKVE